VGQSIATLADNAQAVVGIRHTPTIGNGALTGDENGTTQHADDLRVSTSRQGMTVGKHVAQSTGVVNAA